MTEKERCVFVGKITIVPYRNKVRNCAKIHRGMTKDNSDGVLNHKRQF
jgi:hypothetical protein